MGMHIRIVIELLLTTYSRIHTQMAMTKETLACMLNKKVAKKSNDIRHMTGEEIESWARQNIDLMMRHTSCRFVPQRQQARESCVFTDIGFT